VDGFAGEPALFFERALEQRRVLGRITQACSVEIFDNHILQIVPDGNLARLAAFLAQVDHPLLPRVVEIPRLSLATAPRREPV